MKKTKKESKKIPPIINRESEGTTFPTVVTRTNLLFAGARNLNTGDLVEHVRTMKVISITHKVDDSAEVELEIIKKNWIKKN